MENYAKDKFHMISLICGTKEKKNINELTYRTEMSHRYRNKQSCQREEGRDKLSGLTYINYYI